MKVLSIIIMIVIAIVMASYGIAGFCLAKGMEDVIASSASLLGSLIMFWLVAIEKSDC